MSNVGTRLRELRKARGLTLRALAEVTGVNYSTISNIEAGRERCSERVLRSLSEALDADVEMMLAEAGYRAMPFRVLGNIAAGEPIETTEHIETFDLTEHFSPSDHYLLRVRGDSMILDGIHDGDLAIVKHSDMARSGQTVVAVVEGEEATLKRYDVFRKTVTLSPANKRFRPRQYSQSDVEIRGVLVGVMRTNVE